MDKKTVSVIDLGSNSIRMTIAEIGKDRSIKELENRRETVRVSEKMGPEKTIKPVSFLRTEEAVRKFCKIIKEYDVDKIIAVSTEALRKASNSGLFIDHIFKSTGVRFEIISGEKEAYYDFIGVSDEVDMDNCILTDTGGGSTEIALITKGRVENIISLPLGGVVLTEEFLEKDKVSAPALFNIFKYIHREIEKAFWIDKGKNFPIIAIGGSNKAIGRVLNKRSFSVEEADIFYLKMLGSNLEERKNILGEHSDRADIIIGGLSPVVYIGHRISAERIIISDKGLRDGILAEEAKMFDKII